MNKILIFLVLLSFIISQPSEARREEIRQRRREHDRQLAECILNNTQTSPELKKLIEENKDDHIMKALHPRDHKFVKSDRDIIRNCRREQFDKRREEIRQRREQEHREHPNHENL